MACLKRIHLRIDRQQTNKEGDEKAQGCQFASGHKPMLSSTCHTFYQSLRAGQIVSTVTQMFWNITCRFQPSMGPPTSRTVLLCNLDIAGLSGTQHRPPWQYKCHKAWYEQHCQPQWWLLLSSSRCEEVVWILWDGIEGISSSCRKEGAQSLMECVLPLRAITVRQGTCLELLERATLIVLTERHSHR